MKKPLRLLHLEDHEPDALLIGRSLEKSDRRWEISVVADADNFRSAVQREKFAVILSDSAVSGIDGLAAMRLARAAQHHIPFIFVCGEIPPERAAELKAAGATAWLSKDDLAQLPEIVARAVDAAGETGEVHAPAEALVAPGHPMERLITVVQQLSLARDLSTIMAIVRRAARELTGADGATFVLRDGELCHYADEDAIEPLWKGCRFPLSACISGWAMINKQSVALEDIYADARIPADAYRPTFVKSLVMVPIRRETPIGAIGTYWATPHRATPLEIQLLQALADSTSIAMENVALVNDLEARVLERTEQLKMANADLESFSYSVSHDLRAPLRSIEGFSRMLQEDCAAVLDETGRRHLNRIVDSTEKMRGLIEDLLKLAKIGRKPLQTRPLDLASLARETVEGLRAAHPDRQVEISIPDTLSASGDPGLLRVVMENLLSNAWKYSSKRAQARIEVSGAPNSEGRMVYGVRDNGAGFDPKYAAKLFGVFQRLHSEREFPGTGVGLATVQRIVQKHGGRIWAEAAVDQGAAFYFTLA